MTTNFDWKTGPLAAGLHCYRVGQFFEAHEHWESVWLVLTEPEKSFLQALVQISAAFHHLERGNRLGAMSLLTRSLKRLDLCPLAFCGINTYRLRSEVRNWLTFFEHRRTDPPNGHPAFEIVDTEGNGSAQEVTTP